MRVPTVLAVLTAIAALLPLAPARAADEAPAGAAAPVSVPTVTVATAVVAEVQGRVPLSGTLVARQVVQVYPQVSGFEIVALGAEAGDRVTKGQELARLADATLTAQLAQADAELQRAIAGVRQAESQIGSAEAARTQAVTALDRARALRRSGSGSQAALDQAVAAEAAAQAAAASANDGLAVARAVQAQAEAARGIARLNVDRTRVLAPVDGRVTARAAQLGGVAAAAGEPMFTLIADGTIEFEGEVIESALPDLTPGDRAELAVAGVGPVIGEVRQLPAAVDTKTRLGLVRVALPADDRLLTGLFATGDIITVTRDAVVVPSTAVLADATGERVQVVRDGVVETRPVTAGLLWQGQREILEGLSAGDAVIARAGAFFATGDAVNAVTAPAADAATPAAGPADAEGAAPTAAATGVSGEDAPSTASAAVPPAGMPAVAATEAVVPDADASAAGSNATPLTDAPATAAGATAPVAPALQDEPASAPPIATAGQAAPPLAGAAQAAPAAAAASASVPTPGPAGPAGGTP